MSVLFICKVRRYKMERVINTKKCAKEIILLLEKEEIPYCSVEVIFKAVKESLGCNKVSQK